MAVRQTKLGPGKLTITGAGAPGLTHDLSGQVRKCALVPSVKSDDPLQVLSGETVAGDRTESWALEGSILDDFGTSGSTVEWCFTNRGQTLGFEFVPASANSKKVTGQAVVEATSIGGDVGKTNELDFSFVVLNPVIAAVTP